MSFVDGIRDAIGNLFQAQLGETEDPKELIPGNPEAVQESARSLRSQGDKFEATGETLGQVRISNWFGQASDSFWDKFEPEKIKWYRAADAMREAATQLEQHGETVSWAQDQAQEAIDLWKRGEQATAQAKAQHAADVAKFNQEQTDFADSGGVNVMAPRPPEFSDPGEELRQRAQEVLDRAREQLSERGDAVAGALSPDSGGDEPGWLSTAIGAADAAISEHGLGSTTVSQTLAGADGLSDSQFGSSTKRTFGDMGPEGETGGLDWKAKLYEDSVGVDVWGDEISGSTDLGPATASGKLEASVLGAGAGYEFSLGPDGLTAGANAEAYLAKVAGEGSIDLGPASVGASGEAMVGAEVEASATIGKEGLNLSAEAFAGAKAEGSVHGDVGGIGAGVKGEAWAGVGASADATVGMKDGKFTVGAELGAALGVGGKVGFEVTVDTDKVVDTAKDVAGAVGDAAGAVGDAASAVGDAAGDAAGAVGDFVGSL